MKQIYLLWINFNHFFIFFNTIVLITKSQKLTAAPSKTMSITDSVIDIVFDRQFVLDLMFYADSICRR